MLNQKEYSKKYYKEHLEYYRKYYREYYHTLNGKWHENRQNAKRRNIKWELTIEEFKAFWKKPCYYCGNKIKTIGLDRTNSARGYNINNLVSCCKQCNYAKRGLNQEKFIQQCKKIAQRFKGRFISKR